MRRKNRHRRSLGPGAPGRGHGEQRRVSLAPPPRPDPRSSFLHPLRAFRLLLFGLCSGCLFGGCDNTLVPLAEGGAVHFTVSGFLDTAADTQFVRVGAVRVSGLPGEEDGTDMTVQTTALGSGETHVWQDSLVRLDDGTTGHLFFAAFQPQAGETYTLVVQGTQDRRTEATTRIPDRPVLETEAPENDSLEVRQGIRFLGVADTPWDLQVAYRVRLPESLQTRQISIGYGGRRQGNAWFEEVRLVRDQRLVLGRLNYPATNRPLGLVEVGATIELTSPEWQGHNGFNIKNGAGFFGAIGRYYFSWRLDPRTVEAIGFLDQQGIPETRP